MPTIPDCFIYPPLPSDKDAIRLLTLEAGNFYDPLSCKLTSVTFSQKPKYVALSYTWGDAHPDCSSLPTSPGHSKLSRRSTSILSSDSHRALSPTDFRTESQSAEDSPRASLDNLGGSKPGTMTINGHPFQIRRNLHLALLHLRSPKLPLTLWVDAVCINSDDTEERNAQVAMMSFIYTRATHVLVWLGTKEYRNSVDVFRDMSTHWKAGQGQYFAEFATVAASRLRSSPTPDVATVARIAESVYWTRLWIVQELCLARSLVFAYGASVWADEEFSKWKILLTEKSKLAQFSSSPEGTSSARFEAMLRLLEARSLRYTDAMTLENLIEQFGRSGCVDLKDRVYGLVGLANDVRPFSKPTNAVQSNATHAIPQVKAQHENSTRPREDAGLIQVDYLHSFLRIWSDVVKLLFFHAKGSSSRFGSQIPISTPGETATSTSYPGIERQMSIVRAAALVQEAFVGNVDTEVQCVGFNKNIMDNTEIRALGFYTSQVTHIGPTYKSLIDEFQAQYDWTDSWTSHYHDAMDMETLRKTNEQYLAKIIDYQPDYLARIQEIQSPKTVAWRAAEAPAEVSYIRELQEPSDTSNDDNETTKSKEPRICLGTNHTICLVPSTAKVGDLVVQFWHCDAAVLMRPVVTATNNTTAREFMLVGRVDVARHDEGKELLVEESKDLTLNDKVGGPGIHSGIQAPEAFCVKLDLQILQKISAAVDTSF